MDGDPSVNDERLESVGERIEEAKQAADRVDEGEGLELHHRERDDHGTFEPSGDDLRAGENPHEGQGRDAPGEVEDSRRGL